MDQVVTAPLVGSSQQYTMADGHRVPWILGTQLHPGVGPLKRASKGSRVLLIEAHEFARRKQYHHDKLTVVFAGMR